MSYSDTRPAWVACPKCGSVQPPGWRPERDRCSVCEGSKGYATPNDRLVFEEAKP
jgi:hypothetical protein